MVSVSVMVNCFNEAEHVREALDSVFNQTFQDWEIIFFDNASTDGSGDIATSLGDKVKYFRSESFISLGSARKLAYDQTRGDFIAILDADDIWMPQKLQRQIQLFNENPDLGMVYCDAIYFDDGGDKIRMFQLTQPYRGHVFGNLIRKNFMPSSGMVFRRDALDQLDCAFDDSYSRAQDYDLTLRMAYNFPVDYLDEPLMKWRYAGVDDKPWKKSLVPRVVEVSRAMERMIENNPEIKFEYSGELEVFYKRMDYMMGITAWGNGDRKEAREHFVRHIRDKRFIVVYLLSYVFPSNVFYRIRIAVRNITRGRI